jgi:23S rRNA (adenine2030-N6)-methyltransferase
MNYRHAFHAGNFADVMKHALLARIMIHLRQKESAFRVIDTHAGSGVYDLAGEEAGRTGEWRDGIGRLADASLAKPVAELLAPYLDAVRATNPSGRITRYPGSPALIRHWLRAQDRLIACELEPHAAASLRQHFHGDARTRTIAIDGWTALLAYIPPKERRGLVLIDPPFEKADEFETLGRALLAAHRKWPTGTYLAWYPIKDERACAAFSRELARSGIGKVLQAELIVRAPSAEGLRGSGLIVLNPPWTLESELQTLLPALGALFAEPRATGTKVQWLGAKGR